MEINLTAKEFAILKDLVEMMAGINHYTSVKCNVMVDGWHGKGEASFNRHEHDAKIRFKIEED